MIATIKTARRLQPTLQRPCQVAELLRRQADRLPLRRAPPHRIAILGEVDAHQDVPAIAMLEHAQLRSQRRIDPVDEREHRFEAIAENLLPLLEVLDVALRRPCLEPLAAGAVAELPAF